jgi:hypothetical protein
VIWSKARGIGCLEEIKKRATLARVLCRCVRVGGDVVGRAAAGRTHAPLVAPELLEAPAAAAVGDEKPPAIATFLKKLICCSRSAAP